MLSPWLNWAQFETFITLTLMSSTVRVIQPTGALDSTSGDLLRQEIIDVIEVGAKTVLIDCKQIDFVDSSGLGALVMAMRTVRESGGRLSICSINDQLRMLLELTSMDDVFEVFTSQEAFNQAVAV